MTPQQYDKINALNAFGGCLGFLCVFIVGPFVFALTGSFLLGIGAVVLSFSGAAAWVAALKEKV